MEVGRHEGPPEPGLEYRLNWVLIVLTGMCVAFWIVAASLVATHL